YEVRGFLHTVCLQNDVRDGYRRTLLVCTGFAGAHASKTSCRASPTSPANCDRRDPRPAAVPDSSGGGCARIVAEVTRRPPQGALYPLAQVRITAVEDCSRADLRFALSLCRQLQTQRHDGPVVLFWPHVDDVSEASPPVCDTCGRIHVDPGVRESHVKLGQGSDLTTAWNKKGGRRPTEPGAPLLRSAGDLPSAPGKEGKGGGKGPNRNRRKREQADPEVRQRRQQFVSLSRPVC